MEQKHYLDIENMRESFASGFRIGDHIVVQEKIDGANFSIRYDKNGNRVAAFSRKTELNKENTLRGAFEWSQNLDVNLVSKALGEHIVVFFEWLVPHTVKYPKDMYHNAYCYDAYDTDSKLYLPQDEVKKIADTLGFSYVPVFYDGPFTSWADVQKYVGMTKLGGEHGEGVVVKNQTRLNDQELRVPFYTKIVCEEFKETKAHQHSKRTISPEEAEDFAAKQELTQSIVTDARVTKLLHKLVDDGIVCEDWGPKDMSTISKHICKAVYEDCIKEEKETVDLVGEKFGKMASSMTMSIVREKLSERTRFLMEAV